MRKYILVHVHIMPLDKHTQVCYTHVLVYCEVFVSEIIDENGKVYNYWTVIGLDTKRGAGNTVKWLCRCACGTERSVTGLSLRNGRSKSCGCGLLKIKSSGETPYKRIYQVTKVGAKDRALSFDISYEEFKNIVHRNCYLCGSEPKDKHYSYNRLRYSKGIDEDEYAIFNGIDRVNSEIGYTISNCEACCFTCNRMKTDFTLDFFLSKIKEINKNIRNIQNVESYCSSCI